MNNRRAYIYSVKKRRFLSPISRFVLSLSFFITLFFGLLYLFFQAPFWRVQIFEAPHLSGKMEELTEVVARTLAPLHPVRRLFGPAHILFYPRKSILTSVVFGETMFKQLLVERQLFGRRVSVTPTAYVPFAIYCPLLQSCYFVSDSGVIFARAFDDSAQAFLRIIDENTREIAIGSQAVFEEGYFQGMRDTLTALRAAGIVFDSVRVRDLDVREWSLTTKTGVVFVFSFEAPVNDFASVLSRLPPSVLRETRYIDFRVPNKIYYQ